MPERKSYGTRAKLVSDLGSSNSTSSPDASPNAGEAQLSQHELSALGRKARSGALLLALRTVLVQLVVLVGGVALARLLDPREFGAFAIAQFALSFFVVFGDAGFGAAFIQKQNEPDRIELSTLFFVQLVATLSIAALVWFGAEPFCSLWKDIPPGAPRMLRVLAVALVMSALKVVPTILMERRLLFGRLAAVDVVHTVTFYAVAIGLAKQGYREVALAAGVASQGLASAVLSYALCPWLPGNTLNLSRLRPALSFGLSYQFKNVVGLANSAVTPMYAGAALGARAVGLINWGQTTAYFPLKLVEIMTRVTFPLYSRFHRDEALLADALGRSVQLCGTFTFFFVGLFLGLGRELTEVVFTAKWLPAVPLLQISAGALSIGFLAPLVGAAFDAMGRPRIFARLAVGWTLLNWLVVPITTHYWGLQGFAWGYSVHVIAGNFAVLVVLKRLLPSVRLLNRLLVPALGALLLALAGRLQLSTWVHGVPSLLLAILAGLLTFSAPIALLDRRGFREALSLLPSRRLVVNK